MLQKRLTAEIKTLKKLIEKNELSGVSFELLSDDQRFIKLTVNGPKDTPYENGKYDFMIYYQDSYPVDPPKILLHTKIYHPNIDTKGEICLNILKDAWSPTIQLTKLAQSLQGLLESPNVDDPLNNAAAQHFKTDLDGAIKLAKEYNAKYAK